VSPLARALVLLVTAYRRLVSPWLRPRCRFSPSCSAYADDALRTHGAVRGTWLAVRRLARCHPFHPGGFDPVPLRRSEHSSPAVRVQPHPRAASPPDRSQRAHRSRDGAPQTQEQLT
jgi:putative membrane protein insertion efficiency factor